MNRKPITLAAIAIASMAMITFSSCNGNTQGNNKNDADSTEVVVNKADTAVVQTVSDAEIEEFITNMYNNHLYAEEDFLREYCTDKMMQKLADEYEYDGEGLAFWLFRTSAQDGTPDNDGVKSVYREEDNNDWWRYEFIDEGYKGINRIKILIIDGQIRIDDIERVYDEPSELIGG